MATPSKPIVLAGVGTAFLNVAGKRIKLGTLQDMTVTFSGSLEKVYGGDGLIPIYIFDKEQSVKVDFTDAEFNLDWLAFVKGATMATGGQLIYDEEVTVATAAGQLTKTSLIIPSSVIAVDKATGIAYTNIGITGTPTATQFTATAAGVLAFNAAANTKVMQMNYLYTDTTSNMASITSASLPGYVEIRHTSKPVDMGDGYTNILHTVIYRAKSEGSLSIDHKRQSAATPKISFEVFDAGRSDGAIMTMTEQTTANA